jgi:peptidoglycan/xylan/chitin deacetylase (PgdA/CDA1 family)
LSRGITTSLVSLLVLISITSVFTLYILQQNITSKSASANNSTVLGVTTFPTRLAIINFDDGYKSQFTNAKPILDIYGFKATFFIVCNFVGKSAKQMNSRSIVNFAGKGVEQMTWNDITTLYKQGYQIGAHTMDHLRNMTNMPSSKLNYEIGQVETMYS